MTTPLHDIIAAKIVNQGPMRLDTFMALLLTHPEHGYYKTQQAIGADGDFITAPEISQMFGELCGLWGLDQMISQNIAEAAGWSELGPGRGTLMSDIIRVCASAMSSRMHSWPVHLIEVNQTLAKEQKSKLSPISTLMHHQDLSNLPEEPLIFFANEFFDALPTRQFVAKNGGWFERYVTLADSRFALSLNNTSENELLLPPPSQDGEIAEYMPELIEIISSLTKHVNTFGGAALIIDYGKNNAIGDSLQAVKEHKPVDIFESPGLVDISAWVDFSAIRKTAEHAGGKVYGPQTQGDFLKQLGLYQRAEQLATGASAEERRKIVAAVDRLSSPAQMGGVFKVMAILPGDHSSDFASQIAGFAPPPEMK